ncbi:MAG: hypothetical protein ABIE94_07015 [archaeon]
MRLQILFILGIFAILLYGCIGSNTEGTYGSSNIGNTAVSNNEPVYSVNELIEANNVSFKVTMWGYSNRWENHRQTAHVKYLWVYGISENIGSVPEQLPTSFLLMYRGVNTTPAKIVDLQDYYGLHPNDHYFPGVTKEGFILFKVPEDLKNDETTFMVDIQGQKTMIELTDPTELGTPLSTSDEFVYCKNFSFTAYYASCTIGFTITNNWPIPYHSGEILLANYTIAEKITNNEKKEIYAGTSSEFNIQIDRDLESHEQKSGYRLPYTFSILREEPTFVFGCSDSYCLNYTELGKPGDQIKVTMVLYESDGTIVSDNETFYVTLPDISEK